MAVFWVVARHSSQAAITSETSVNFYQTTSRNNPEDNHLHTQLGFEVLTAVSMKIAVFWVVAPCSLVEVYQRF
jgi:hypothetical protein